MSQLAIIVTIFVLMGIYVPLSQLNNAQQKDLQNRFTIHHKRSSIVANQWELFVNMSSWQKSLIFLAIFFAIIALVVFFSWDKLVKYL